MPTVIIRFAESAVTDLEEIKQWYTEQGVPDVGVSSTLSYSKLHKWQGEDIMQHIVLKG